MYVLYMYIRRYTIKYACMYVGTNIHIYIDSQLSIYAYMCTCIIYNYVLITIKS